MLMIRRSEDRGYVDFGWLKTFHTFSFGDYKNLDQMNFRSLRVINEDRVEPGQGFGSHSHRNMEIVTYVVQGHLAHQDNLGNGSIIGPGDVQRLSAGTGVIHGELNASDKEPVHFLQIWISPNHHSLPPSYEQAHIPWEEKENILRIIASQKGTERGVKIDADIRISTCVITGDEPLQVVANPSRYYWVQVISGQLRVNHEHLKAGDGLAIQEEGLLSFSRVKMDDLSDEVSHFLLFDLA